MENWLPIPGYEGRYEVSDKGRVKRLPFVTKNGAYMPRKFLKKEYTKKCQRGYRMVSLMDSNGHVRKWFVHRLVLLAFVGPCPEGKEVCHNDGNSKNNKLENLRYDTRTENQIDISRCGHRNNGIDDPSIVPQMRKAYANGERIVDIANRYSLKYRTVYDILKGKTYTWI